jgi:hypothetical protein
LSQPDFSDLSDLEISLLEEVRDFWDVFSTKKAEKLPTHRSHDQVIHLLEGRTPSFGSLYPMSRDDLKALKEWLGGNGRRGHPVKLAGFVCNIPPCVAENPAERKLRITVHHNKVINHLQLP